MFQKLTALKSSICYKTRFFFFPGLGFKFAILRWSFSPHHTIPSMAIYTQTSFFLYAFNIKTWNKGKRNCLPQSTKSLKTQQWWDIWSFPSPQLKEASWTFWGGEGSQCWLKDWSICHMRKSWDHLCCSAWGREGLVGSSQHG